MKKSFQHLLSPFIECNRPQGTVSFSPEASVTITVDKLRPFLQQLRGCWKHNFLKKKGTFPKKKNFWPVFSPKFELDKPQGTALKGPKTTLTITMEVVWSYLQDVRGCSKHNFLKKKANFPVGKGFWPVFHRTFEFEKPQVTVSFSPEASLLITVEKLRSFFRT